MTAAQLALLAAGGLGLGLGLAAWKRARGAADVPPGALAAPSWRVLTPDELDARFGPLKWEPAPTSSNPEGIKITNAAEWGAKIVPVDLPAEWADLAPWQGKRPPRAWIHRDVAPHLLELLAAWRAAGLLGAVKGWGGDYNPRHVRGSTTRLSAHAYGVAVDVNPGTNPMGQAAAAGDVAALVPIARALGWYWGGWFTRPDAMHFEFVGKAGDRVG